MKSQTYQQFMKNMEQIIELLDDTESPNFNSGIVVDPNPVYVKFTYLSYFLSITEETDENVECISSKMLTVVSNDVAKLKAKGALDSIPKNKLTLLINYAMRNVYLARNYSAGPVSKRHLYMGNKSPVNLWEDGDLDELTYSLLRTLRRSSAATRPWKKFSMQSKLVFLFAIFIQL